MTRVTTSTEYPKTMERRPFALRKRLLTLMTDVTPPAFCYEHLYSHSQFFHLQDSLNYDRISLGDPSVDSFCVWVHNKVVNGSPICQAITPHLNAVLPSEPEFANNFFEGYESFKVGVLLRQERDPQQE